jgi:L-lactate dehydrogenase complex protein LldG
LSARERILGRLRAARQTAPPVLPDVARWYAEHRRGEALSQRVARLRSALLAAHAEVHDTNSVDWPDVLLRIAAAKGIRRLLIGNATPHAATLEARRPSGLDLIRYDRPIEDWRNSLFDDVDAGLTLAKGAIAETGSLILWPDANEPRAMSLVPALHFVLLHVRSIHADLHEAMTAGLWRNGLPSNALLVSGPSKTADIQQTLAYGAHGPRELIVLLIDDEGGGA